LVLHLLDHLENQQVRDFLDYLEYLEDLLGHLDRLHPEVLWVLHLLEDRLDR
jgi:hypothetical protein